MGRLIADPSLSSPIDRRWERAASVDVATEGRRSGTLSGKEYSEMNIPPPAVGVVPSILEFGASQHAPASEERRILEHDSIALDRDDHDVVPVVPVVGEVCPRRIGPSL